MKDEKFIQLNIAFRIPEDVAKVAIKLSREIAKKEDVYFVLDGINYFPHATIYPGEFPEKNLEKVIQAIDTLAKQFYPIDMIFTHNRSSYGWLGPNFNYSEDIRKIHETVIEKINPLREGQIRDKYKNVEYLEKLSSRQRENVEEYGHPNLMDLYEPHVTVTKLKDETHVEKFTNEIKWEIAKFKIYSIGIFMSGEHGTCRKLLREFKLGKI